MDLMTVSSLRMPHQILAQVGLRSLPARVFLHGGGCLKVNKCWTRVREAVRAFLVKLIADTNYVSTYAQ